MHEQLSTDALGMPLSQATFVVVDLETTGGSPAEAGITEIGAVRIRGGEVIGEYSTLVNPGIAVPPFVAALTGITDALLMTAPRLEAVLPSFLEFMRGSILIAHNAPYDVGFLKGACRKLEYPWPGPQVLDTARIARVTLQPGEVRNCKLGTLAAHFHATVTPTHRAFDDARATADVFHALVARLGNLGVQTVEDLQAFSSKVSPTQRSKRHLADGLPDAPGVYVFKDQTGTALYIGTSKSIRTRVRGYFTASENRRRMAEMVGIAHEVTPIVCASTLEARVRELRLIAEHQPRYNHRSKRPEKQVWLKLTAEHAPRLSVVRAVLDDSSAGARYLGPFPSAGAAHFASEALALAFPLRTCTAKIARRPRTETPGCVRAELGTCPAPCTASGNTSAYDDLVQGAQQAMAGNARAVIEACSGRMAELSEAGRFEDAAGWRDRLAAYLHASVRTQRLAMLAANPEILAAQQTPEGGWEIHCIRFGSLAGAVTVDRGVDPRPALDALRRSADHVTSTRTLATSGLAEEADAISAWLEGARLVEAAVPLSLPVACGGELALRLSRVQHVMRDSAPAAGDYQWHSRHVRSGEQRPIGARELPVTRIRTA
jgi:DNA polymerase-3 subunit epsilon